jgi:alpha-glucosidase
MESKTHGQQVHDYVYSVRSALNKGGLFSDGSCYYVNPQEPEVDEEVKIRFRAAADNVDSVYLIYNEERVRMDKESSNRIFDFYSAVIPGGLPFIRYHFEIHSGKVTCFYDKLGPTKNNDREYDFEICPGFKVPEWAKGAVFYQIYVDRFNNGDSSNDVLDNEYFYIGQGVQQVKDWNENPSTMDVGRFYGGDLQGVMDKLDYLKDLGVDAIYLNPIFVSPSNHKYDIQDYDYVDPHFGRIVYDEGECLPEGCQENKQSSRYINRVTDKRNLEASNQLFIQLVEEIHKRGMKVILDGVFNHCGSFNKWMDRELIYENQEGYEKGAYVDSESPYRTFFKFQDEGQWPYNNSYDGWWGHDTLPKLNYEESPKLKEYILRIAKKWVSPPFNADGWRLDVAADLGHSPEYNHRFWREFRDVVKEANPNAIVLAEHYGDPRAWLKGDQWDTVMNYDAFMEPITWFLCGVEKHSDEFRGDLLGNFDAFKGAMNYHMSRFLRPSVEVSMNELSNHDHSRFLTRTNRRVGRLHTAGAQAANEGVNKGIFRQAVVFQMTWPGAPTIYYGDEAGLCGWTDPDNRRTYPWGREDQELIQFHKDMIKIHKSYEALKTGSMHYLYGGYKIMCYGRFTDNKQVVVILNTNYEEQHLKLHVRQIGVYNHSILRRVMLTTEDGYTLEPEDYMVEHNVLTITVPSMSAMVLVRA